MRIALVIGGTNTKCALFRDNRIARRTEVPTCAGKGKKFMLDNIIRIVSEVYSDKKIGKIGVGVPGPVDRKKGIVLNPPNVPWKNLPLKRILEKEFRTEVCLENDANCAALDVARNSEFKNFVLLTLGTGVGGAVVTDGKIYRGKGNAGEMGHVVIEKNGFRCHCGNRGCLEEYVSSRGFERLAKKYLGKRLGPKETEAMARKGNKKAIRVYREAGSYLGTGLASISNILDPDAIFLSGKISRSGSLLTRPARDEMKSRVIVRPPKILVAEEDAELYGAARL